MFKNYLAAALRNLARNRLYAGINIVGLAVGFAAAILIALFVRDELTFDHWIPGHERTYLLYETDRLPGRGTIESEMTYDGVADWLRLDFPQIESVGRLAAHSFSFRHGAVETVDEQHYWADPDIFSVMPMKAVAGDPRTALNRPDGIVMTRRMARKYFGRDDPLGETLEINRQQLWLGHDMTPMHVTAVIEDLPSDTHLNAEIFISALAPFSYPRAAANQHFTPNQVPEKFFFTYIRLAPGVSVDALQRALPAFVDRHFPPEIRGLKRSIGFELRPIADIHMHSTNVYGFSVPGSMATVYAIAGVGLLIVLMAGINFVNLMTARAVRRAIEVGIRKVSGADRIDLILQFLGESLIYVVLGMVLATALVELILPTFNTFLDRTIVFDYWRAWQLDAGIAGVVLTVALLAGFYPAFVLSSFRPANVLKGGQAGPSGSGKIRQWLVILQFAILIGLLLTTGIIYRQILYALNEGLRLDKDQMLLVGGACSNRADGGAFKDAVRTLPGVRAAGCGDIFGSWLNPASQGAGVTLRDGTKTNFRISKIDFGLLELYGLRPLAGRFFSRDYGADSLYPDGKAELPLSGSDQTPGDATTNPPIVINETAMRRLGYASPQLAVGQSVPWVRGLGKGKFSGPVPSQIIGVVPDFSMGSVRDAVDPVFFFIAPPYSDLNIKLNGRDIPETLRAVDALWDKVGDSARPITRIFVDQKLQQTYLDITRQGQLFAAFAGVAVFIACLGLFGLSAFTAERRTKEIGIRKAMGASRLDIVRLLVWQFTKPVLLANLIAWPVGYYFMSRWLHGFAYHVDLSLWIFLAAGTAALVIALATVSAHAFLVARAKPVTALRYE